MDLKDNQVGITPLNLRLRSVDKWYRVPRKDTTGPTTKGGPSSHFQNDVVHLYENPFQTKRLVPTQIRSVFIS